MRDRLVIDARPVSADPVADRIKALRLTAGMTLRELARRATLAIAPTSAPGSPDRKPLSVSAPYISLIENGHKVPDEAIAVALADALGEDRALFRAWVRTRKRADLGTALAAAETLKKMLAELPHPRPAAPGTSVSPRERAPMPGTSGARLRVPVIAEGADPGDSIRPSCEVLEWLRLDAGDFPPERRNRLDRPFAWRVSAAGVARVVDRMQPHGYALVLRDFAPLTHDDVYAVRHLGRVLLSRLMWNGRQLLLLPAKGESDFVVLEAPDAARVNALVLGAVMVVPLR
jgi:transcriptional regulator with XRE-family HTH domain